MFGLGAGELFLIFIIALLFLGPKKLPDLARGLGQAIHEFQKARHQVTKEMDNTFSTPADLELAVAKRESTEMDKFS